MTAAQLKPFCGDGFGLQEPFSIGDFTFATNRAILIRVPRIHEVEEKQFAPKPSSIRTLLSPIPINAKWSTLPEIPPKKDDKCEACGGKGQHRCILCGSLHGCQECAGFGLIDEIQRVEIGRREFDADLLRLISTLPRLRILRGGEPESPMLFKFKSGIGVLAPLKCQAGHK